jgi:hypothetical protein
VADALETLWETKLAAAPVAAKPARRRTAAAKSSG